MKVRTATKLVMQETFVMKNLLEGNCIKLRGTQLGVCICRYGGILFNFSSYRPGAI